MIQQSPLQSSTETQQQPLITVITVSFNAVKTIEQTMLSVLNQTYPNIEYIIIDGGSTDGTVDIIKKYADRLAYWVSEPDKGIYDAMNKGIGKATGEWINFMNSGDCFLSINTLSDVEFDKLADCDVICGDNVIPKRGGEFYLVKATPFFIDSKVKHSMGFNHQTVFVRTTLAKKHPFNLAYKIAADYDMIMWLGNNGYKFKYVPIPIAYTEMNGVSTICKIKHMSEIRLIDGIKLTKAEILLIYFIRYKLLFKRKIANVIFKINPEFVRNRQLKGCEIYEKNIPFL